MNDPARHVPSAVRFLPAADRAAVAWKNGGGVTREVAGFPGGAGMADFSWRVSLAEVGADGPFSAFPEVDRTLTMVEGDGMRLTVGGRDVVVDTPYVPRDFPGDVPTDCRLLGAPVVNFNVMWRRGAVSAPPSVTVLRGRIRLPGTALLVALGAEGAEVAGRELGHYDAVSLAGGDVDVWARGPVGVVTGL
ncbi:MULTISPECIES: HutD family protein [unclassified Streptomyces]|uniref:HutD/Ves family protein n=1 Tax=unclassified Streptomyces TaxID=2593676 RepID=UPI00278C5C5D|nr:MULTISPECIES: HutD family protein [unclassified Streptomyces]